MTTRFCPTKMLLYQTLPKLIAAYRLPWSDGTPGRRKGPANEDELAGARDVLYHLLSDAGVHKMADHLRCDPKDVYNAIDLALYDLSLAKTEEENESP